MTKEQILRDLEDIILTFKGDTLKHPEMLKRWQKKRILTIQAHSDLNLEDKDWIAKEYKEWHKDNIVPLIPKDIPQEMFN